MEVQKEYSPSNMDQVANKSKLVSNLEQQRNTSRDNNSARKRNNFRRNKNGNVDGPTDDVQLSKSLSWVLRHTAPSLGLHPTSDGFVPVDDLISLNHPRFRKSGNGQRESSRDDGGKKYTVEDVIRVVETNDKKRFKLEYKELTQHSKIVIGSSNSAINKFPQNIGTVAETNKTNLVLCIRANQGHSYKNIIVSDELLSPLTKEELSDPNLDIIHGTTRKAWRDHICKDGLRRMKRNHIHFATGLPSMSCSNKHPQGRIETKGVPVSGMRASSQIYIYIDGEKCASDSICFYRSDNGVILTAGVNDEGLLPVKYFKKVVIASTAEIIDLSAPDQT